MPSRQAERFRPPDIGGNNEFPDTCADRLAGALGVVMIVAVKVAQWEEVDSLQTLLGLEEIMYLALFIWLAIAGPGQVSIDRWLERRGKG